MKIKNICVYNLYPAIMGIRNSFKSKEKSDSTCTGMYGNKHNDENTSYNHAIIGKKDQELLKKLLKGQGEYGHQERKFLRQILVSMDIVGSIKFWSQMDTFKIATVRNSESTMHRITSKGLFQDDFERGINEDQLMYLNNLITDYDSVKKRYPEEDEYQIEEKRRELKEIFELIDANLPGGYILESHWTGNYENMRNIYHGRKNHKMYWWSQFCDYIEKFPYFDLMIKGE